MYQRKFCRNFAFAFLLWGLSCLANAQDFETVRSFTHTEAGINFFLQVGSERQSGLPAELRIVVENETDKSIEISYPQSTGPAIFGISYMGEFGSTRQSIPESADGSYLHQELLPQDETYWTYSLQDILERTSVTINELVDYERFSVVVRVRFYVSAPTEEDPNKVELVEAGLGWALRT